MPRAPKEPREKVIYFEAYRKGVTVKRESLPITRHTDIYQPIEMHLLRAGVVTRGDLQLEFQDVRLYFPRAPREEQKP